MNDCQSVLGNLRTPVRQGSSKLSTEAKNKLQLMELERKAIKTMNRWVLEMNLLIFCVVLEFFFG